MHVSEVEHGPDPAGAPGDLDDIGERAEVAHAAHHLDAERHRAVLALESLAQAAELLDDGVQRSLPAPAE